MQITRTTATGSVVALAMAGLLILCASQGQADPQPPAADVPNNPAPSGVLVLKSGTVMQGRILKSGDNYEVKTDGSTIFVPGKLVKVHAETLVDAFQTMRKEIPEVGGDADRLALAKWCITNRLITQARDELRTILGADATNEAARDLLRKIDEILDPPGGIVRHDVKEQLRLTRLGFAEEVPPLAGLPRDIGQEFVRRVQPILMNNCALAACHGPQGASEFQLQRVNAYTRSFRGPTETNLHAVLRQIDDAKPRNSPLLTVPQTDHGIRSRPVFQGSRGDDQLAVLRSWAISVSKARNVAVKAAERKSANADPEARPAAPPIPQLQFGPPIDPFDPRTYNRRP